MLEFIIFPYDVNENHITTSADKGVLTWVCFIVNFLRTTVRLTVFTDSLDSLLCTIGKPTEGNIQEPAYVIWFPSRCSAENKKIPKAGHKCSVKT